MKLKKEKGIVKDAEQVSVEEQIAQAEAAVGTAEHHAREWEIAQAGMTLLKNEGHALPLTKEESVLILYPTETRQASVEYAVSRLKKEGLLDPSKVTSMCYENLAKDDPDLAKALADAGKVIVLSQAVSRNEVITGAMDQIHKAGGQAVLLSLNLPYDAACYEEADAVLCAYQPYGSAHDAEGNGPFNLNVAVSGEGENITFEDELLYERGFGLEIWGD